MTNYLVSYVTAGVIFLGLDFCWLYAATGRLYRVQIGSLLLAQPSLPVAGLFYLIYTAGVVMLAVLPNAREAWWNATAAGAMLGLVAYGTYDFTNLATLRGWSGLVTVLDLAWGTLVTSLAATGAKFALDALS